MAICAYTAWPELNDLDLGATSLRVELVADAARRELVDARLFRFSALASVHLSGIGLQRLDDGAASVEDDSGQGEGSGGSADDDAGELLVPCGLRSLVKIRDLELGNNCLGPRLQPEGALHGLTSLRSLDLQGNKLEILPAALVSLTSLSNLNVNFNCLTGLPWMALSLLPELRAIAAAHNQLERLSTEQETSLPPRLSELTLCANRLSDDGGLKVLADVASLTSLDVSENLLSTLPQELATGSAKLQRLAICSNRWADKKLAKLADSQGEQGQVPAKPVLELLRKGQSMRQLKAERSRTTECSAEVPPRQYVCAATAGESSTFAPPPRETAPEKTAKGKAKKNAAAAPAPEATTGLPALKCMTVSRDALGVRPYVLATLLHVVVDGDDAKPFVFCAEGAEGVPVRSFASNFQANLGLIEQGLEVPGGDESAVATRKALSRLQTFITAQTRIHSVSELGNKRRAGTLGSHNAEVVHWPLHFKALPHEEVKFSPLAIGWMESKGVVSAAAFAREAARGSVAGAAKEVASALQAPAKDLLSMPLCPHLVDAQDVVMSVHPLSNGWQTRTTADARSALVLECSSSQDEAVCRRMLLALVREAIDIVEEGQHAVRVLLEPVEVVCDWNQRLRRAIFPNREELLSLPALPPGCLAARGNEAGKTGGSNNSTAVESKACGTNASDSSSSSSSSSISSEDEDLQPKAKAKGRSTNKAKSKQKGR